MGKTKVKHRPTCKHMYLVCKTILLLYKEYEERIAKIPKDKLQRMKERKEKKKWVHGVLQCVPYFADYTTVQYYQGTESGYLFDCLFEHWTPLDSVPCGEKLSLPKPGSLTYSTLLKDDI